MRNHNICFYGKISIIPKLSVTPFYLEHWLHYITVIQDEFAAIRIRIKDVLDENARLHEELKRSVMEEIAIDPDLIKVRNIFVSSFELRDHGLGLQKYIFVCDFATQNWHFQT